RSWSDNSLRLPSSMTRRRSCKIGLAAVLAIMQVPSTESGSHRYSSLRQAQAADFFPRNLPRALRLGQSPPSSSLLTANAAGSMAAGGEIGNDLSAALRRDEAEVGTLLEDE